MAAAMYHHDALDKAQEEADQVKALMKENVNKVAERGEKLEDLHGRTEVLEEETKTFRRSAGRVKWLYGCKNMKMTILLILVGILAVGTIAAIVFVVITTPWSQSDEPHVDVKNTTKFGG